MIDRILKNIDKYRLIYSLSLIILAIISFAFISVKNDKLYVPYFYTKYKKVCFNIELPYEYKNKVSLLVNDKVKKIDCNGDEAIFPTFYTSERKSNSLNEEEAFPVSSLKIKIKGNCSEVENIIENIKSVILFISDEMTVYENNEVKTFVRTDCDDGGTVLVLPKPDKALYWNSYEHSYLNSFVISFLSAFINWTNYIFPWILLIFGFSLFPRSKINVNIIFGLIFLLSYLLRQNMLTMHPASVDELDVIVYCGANFLDGFKGLFADVGNPPFVNLVYQILTRYSYDIGFIRTFFVLTGTLGTLAIYMLAKDRLTNKVAIVSSFLYAVSLFSICLSQCARSYIISFTVAPLFVYMMFKVFEEKKLKYYIWFTVFGIILINNHLYGIIFLGLNFLYGIGYFILKKEYGGIKKFVISFVIMGCSFLPYFCVTMAKLGLFSENFQSWIQGEFLLAVETTYGSCALFFVVAFIAVVAAFYRKYLFPSFSKKQNEFYTYLVLIVILFYASLVLISCWRQIIASKYLSMIYGLSIILIASFVEIRYKIVNLVILYFLFLQTQTYPWWICFNSYRDRNNLVSYYAKNHKVVIDFYLSNICELLEYRDNFIILDNKVYNLWDKESDKSLKSVLDRFVEINPDTVFLIQPNYMHDIDITYFLESDENKKYDVSLIKTPYYYMVKIVLKRGNK